MSNKHFIGLIVVIVVAVMAFAFMSRSDDSANQPDPTTGTTDPVGGSTTGIDNVFLNTGSRHTYGQSADEIVITEVIDFSCPGCASKHLLMRQSREKYQDSIIFTIKHFPISNSHPHSRAAHRAAEAAGKQGKFWEMHDMLFEQRETWVAASVGVNQDPVPKFEQFATDIGLDLDQFKDDFKSKAVNDAIQADISLLKKMKVASTPTFFLNDNEVDKNLITDQFFADQIKQDQETDSSTEEPVEAPITEPTSDQETP